VEKTGALAEPDGFELRGVHRRCGLAANRRPTIPAQRDPNEHSGNRDDETGGNIHGVLRGAFLGQRLCVKRQVFSSCSRYPKTHREKSRIYRAFRLS
jgi:hypothetical protein